MKRPADDDFTVDAREGSVTVTFKPTKSHYTFDLLVDPADIARFGPLSPDVRVRHAGPSGDTDEFWSDQVAATARRLAEAAVRPERA